MAKKTGPKKAAAKKQAAKTGGKATDRKKPADSKLKAAAKTGEKKPATTDPTPKPRDDSDEIVVFAIRLKRFERDLIHKAAGSGKASKFVRGLAVAAARGGMKTLEAIVKTTDK